MMVGFRRLFFLLGMTAGVLSSVNAMESYNRTKDLKLPLKLYSGSKTPSSLEKATSRRCSSIYFMFFFHRIPADSSIIVTSNSRSANFCGLIATVQRGQQMSINCTQFNLPSDFRLRFFTLSDDFEVTQSNKEHTFPVGERRLLFFISGPRFIDLTTAFRCEVSSSSPQVDIVTEAPSNECQCGVPNEDDNGGSTTTFLDERIVGGSDAPEGKHPWAVRLTTRPDGGFFCGGTLITSTKIVSAAHCDIRIDEFAHIGEYDTTVVEEYTVIRNITAVRNHPDYNSNTLDNDIAIATIDSPVTFSSKISPICLPLTNRNYENEMATAVGWGTLSSGGSVPTVLQEVDVPVKSRLSCRLSYLLSDITNQMICAGEEGKDSCQGDSGGPLLFRSTSADPFELIGVTSWGIGCGSPGYPGVYARITALMSFILENVGSGSELCARP